MNVKGSELRSVVLEELELLSASNPFCHSRQAVRLLRYLVEQTLDGAEDQLRERAIGVRIFGRDPKYDTNEDAIVRVGVAEVRKRLARALRRYDPEARRSPDNPRRLLPCGFPA